MKNLTLRTFAKPQIRNHCMMDSDDCLEMMPTSLPNDEPHAEATHSDQEPHASSAPLFPVASGSKGNKEMAYCLAMVISCYSSSLPAPATLDNSLPSSEHISSTLVVVDCRLGSSVAPHGLHGNKDLHIVSTRQYCWFEYYQHQSKEERHRRSKWLEIEVKAVWIVCI
jgi:hypothetical protein